MDSEAQRDSLSPTRPGCSELSYLRQFTGRQVGSPLQMFASLPTLWANSRATLASSIGIAPALRCSGPGCLCLLTALIKKTRSGQDSREGEVVVLPWSSWPIPGRLVLAALQLPQLERNLMT